MKKKKKKKMAGNVFGNPITDDDVKILYPEVTDITPKLRADVAFRNISTNGRDQNAKNFVKNLKQRYGNGISALCMIFNATGGTLTYSGNKDWHGHVYESPYPAKIQNGQWGAFLHVHPSWFAGSEAAVIYRGYNNDGTLCDWMLSWGIPYIGDNHVAIMRLITGTISKDCWKANPPNMKTFGMDAIQL
ncbi:hypothetical protein FEM48_Zijuj04G0191600 [Ziziphus jujuba var. spinosa]|uniref:23 kDa jasmonate-induced protein-like n=1 Tax=Ziziphus jujuba var. spinosa TaxID=714518 RepID=A0A978VLN4_ZIZJJ|nr:hypothetical protein FEM48_Zijuj04G0191600 [Ziziphus jujuba var. spinosa]